MFVSFEGQAEPGGVAPVVAVDGVPFGVGDGGEDAAGADGEEAEPQHQVAVPVLGAELRRDGGCDGVVACVHEAGVDEDEGGFFVGHDAERAERVGEVEAVMGTGAGEGVAFVVVVVVVVGRMAGLGEELALVEVRDEGLVVAGGRNGAVVDDVATRFREEDEEEEEDDAAENGEEPEDRLPAEVLR